MQKIKSAISLIMKCRLAIFQGACRKYFRHFETEPAGMKNGSLLSAGRLLSAGSLPETLLSA